MKKLISMVMLFSLMINVVYADAAAPVEHPYEASSILIYAFYAVVIAITAGIIIVLINKKKK